MQGSVCELHCVVADKGNMHLEMTVSKLDY